MVRPPWNVWINSVSSAVPYRWIYKLHLHINTRKHPPAEREFLRNIQRNAEMKFEEINSRTRPVFLSRLLGLNQKLEPVPSMIIRLYEILRWRFYFVDFVLKNISKIIICQFLMVYLIVLSSFRANMLYFTLCVF